MIYAKIAYSLVVFDIIWMVTFSWPNLQDADMLFGGVVMFREMKAKFT
jgi:hypothetical protein